MSLIPFSTFGRDLFSPAEDFLGGWPFGRDLLSAPTTTQAPAFTRALAIDVVEKDDQFQVHADVPGVSKDDIKVTVEQGNVLSISVDKTEEKKEEKGNYRRFERTSNFARRSLRFPDNADLENIKARYENGVLTLDMPKKPETETQKRITIS